MKSSKKNMYVFGQKIITTKKKKRENSKRD